MWWACNTVSAWGCTDNNTAGASKQQFLPTPTSHELKSNKDQTPETRQKSTGHLHHWTHLVVRGIMELKRQSIYTAVRDVKMVPLMRTGILILHFGDAGAGAGDALPRRAAGVAAAGRPAGQLRRAVPGSVEISQCRSCKEWINESSITRMREKEKKTRTIPRNQSSDWCFWICTMHSPK